MSEKWQVVCPCLFPPWNAQQMLESAGEITVPFLLIDNSPNSNCKDMKISKDIEVQYHPENLGTSMSWNLGIMRGAKWTLILSASTRFPEGGLKKYLEGAENWANEFGFFSPIGGHCHAVGKSQTKLAGLWDPNFFPGYKEDSSMGHILNRTMSMVGAIPHYSPPGLHIVASAVAVRSSCFLDQRPAQREAYYLAKHGGKEGYEKFEHPFNDPTKPIQYWPQPEWFKNRGLPEWDWYQRL